MRTSPLATLAVALLIAAMASDAQACTRPWRNMFADFGQPPGARELRKARYIDWVEITAKGPPACERDRAWTNEALEADGAGTDDPLERTIPLPPAPTTEGLETSSCSYQARTALLQALEARVIEPLKGAGSTTFPLAYSRDPLGAPQRAYADPRTTMIEVEQSLPASHAEGVALHNDPGFNDHGELHVDRDMTDSCGGSPTALIGGRYVAFRNAKGAVLALEPVADRNDPWFDRVRRFATEPDGFANPPLDVADFFRASTGVALVRITSCSRPGGRFGPAEIEAQLLRGGFSAGWMADWVKVPTGPEAVDIRQREDDPSFGWIPDYLQRIGSPCRAGKTLLVMSGPFDREGDSPPRAARVAGVGFYKGDLLTGYRLIGPDKVSIDQAFAWVEEGRKARAAER